MKIKTILFSLLFVYTFCDDDIAFNCFNACTPKTIEENISPKDVLLAPAGLCQQRKCGPYLNVSAMVWQSKEGNLEYVAKEKVFVNEVDNSKEKAEFIIPDFAWRPGIKVDLGFLFDYDGWDARALWTIYRGEFTHVKKHSNAEITPVDNGIVPFYFYQYFNGKISPPQRFQHATGDWDMHFNSIDVEMGRNFFIRKKLSLRLLCGVKCAWINHVYNVELKDGNHVTSSNGDDITFIKSNHHFKNNSVGAGPRMGFESKLFIKWGFKFLANSSVSALYTNFDVSRDQDDQIYDHLVQSERFVKNITKESFSLIKPNIQLLLGIEWGTCFCKGSSFAISLAYEMQYFFGQNQIRRFMDDQNIAEAYSNKGDLQMQGLTASLKFEF